MIWSLLLGLVISLLGCVALYTSSPNQLWVKQPWPAFPTRLVSILLIISGVPFLRQAFLPVTLIFVLTVWIMLWLTLLPYIGVFVNGLSGDTPNESR